MIAKDKDDNLNSSLFLTSLCSLPSQDKEVLSFPKYKCRFWFYYISVYTFLTFDFVFYYSFWGIKYLLVIGGIIGAFFIPEGSFGITWMYFGLIGGFLFIIIQLILIIDFAHSWAEKWVDNYEETESKAWLV